MTIQDRKAEDLTYGFVGLGLMGGSFAKGIRENILNKSQAQGRFMLAIFSLPFYMLPVSRGLFQGFYS